MLNSESCVWLQNKENKYIMKKLIFAALAGQQQKGERRLNQETNNQTKGLVSKENEVLHQLQR